MHEKLVESEGIILKEHAGYISQYLRGLRL